eukprot:5395469-Lingulodinium_polyedra.AAC.1
MRMHRPSAAATARKWHNRAPHARARKLARASNAQTCDSRTGVAADGRSDRIAAQRFANAA